MNEMAQWLEEQGLGALIAPFAANDLDLDILQDLTDEELKGLGVSIGHCKRLKKALSARNTARLSISPASAADPKAAASLVRVGPERRHLTVMFCDLVGSTSLSTRLDPEELREVIDAYQKWCADIVSHFGGFIAKYMGDGVLVYFGYPRANEDDAERAVRAGLRLVEVPFKLRAEIDFNPKVRVGIASGLVVVGELLGEGMAQEQAVVGETPNLAARLQSLAEPNAVVIAPATHRLLGELFEYTDLGAHELKGFAQPVRARQVLCEKPADSRFEATHTAVLTPVVGRDAEISMLLEKWQQAMDGEGQVVLLCGEPGMGKSRMTQALHERLAAEPHSRLRYQCSPYFANTALYPFIDQMERIARIGRDDTTDVKLDKLEEMFAPMSVTEEELHLFGGMLSIPTSGRYPALEMSPQRQKEKLIETVAKSIIKVSSRLPTLLVFEDAHWSDPTSLEALTAIIENVQRSRVLVVITYRPEFKPSWRSYAYVTTHLINRLARRYGTAMVDQITGGKRLPPQVLEQIVAKTDGVPLFVEELTKTVLESGLLVDKGDRYELEGPLPPLAIPATLHDSLMARLDRLAPVKETAQIGAALGREFSYELISAISPLPDKELLAALDQLTESELIHRRGTPLQTTYAFKHALVQDAAYESLLKSRRQQLHTKIAKTFEEQFPHILESEPELIAHHYTAAGMPKPAILYWAKAGRRAMENSAYLEAVGHLRNGLAMVRELPLSAKPAEQELMLLNLLATPLMYTKGYAAPEAREVYERAHRLCETVGESVHIFQARCGVSTYHMVRGELDRALELSEEMLRQAEAQREEGAILESHRLNGLNALYCGQFKKSVAHCDHVRTLFDPARHRRLALVYGQDHRMSSCVITAQATAALGYSDQARRWRLEALAEAERTNHHFSRAYARSMTLTTLQYLRDTEGLRHAIEDAVTYATEQSIVFWLLYARFFQGWILLEDGKPAEAISLLRESVAAYRATGSEVEVLHAMTALAQALVRTGAIDEAFDVLAQALEQTERGGERHYEADTHRIRGDLLASTSNDPDRAESAYLQALTVARRQEAKLFELRAATSLARLWHRHARTAEAQTLLNPIYGWFTEGFNETDLQDARAALNEFEGVMSSK
jgi:class 3 adenylate cyclase/predicted ATPase